MRLEMSNERFYLPCKTLTLMPDWFTASTAVAIGLQVGLGPIIATTNDTPRCSTGSTHFRHVPDISVHVVNTWMHPCITEQRESWLNNKTDYIAFYSLSLRVGPGHPSSPLSIYFLIFSLFYFSPSFIGFTYFLLLSVPSLCTRIVPLRF